MPKVYDWNGTAASEIKKIYDWNGSAATQIKKGYDHNGSANSLIYSAETIILDGSDKATAITGGYVAASKPSGAYQDASSTSAGIVCAATSHVNRALFTNNTINLSNYNKMTVYVTISNSNGTAGYNTARGYGILANSSKSYTWNAPDYDTAVNWGTNYQWRKYIGHITGTEGTTSSDISNGTKVYTVDISKWTGNKYIGLIAGCSAGNTLTATFTKIVLE